MKKLIILCTAIVLSVQLFAFEPVNEKLVQSFRSHFPHAAQVAWQELPEAFVVSFVSDGIRSRAIFNKDGRLQQVMRFYQEQHLPYEIAYRVKRNYPNRKVYGVVEVSATSDASEVQTTYFIKLEDNKSWLTVKVTPGGAFYVTEKLRKE